MVLESVLRPRAPFDTIRAPRGTQDISLSTLEEFKPPTRLHSLSMKCWNMDLLRWLKRHHKTPDRLTTFKMMFDGTWRILDPAPINAVFRVGYTSLQVVASTTVECHNGFLDMSTLTELQTIVLYVYRFPSGMQTIPSLNSGHIETVTFITSDDESMVSNYLDSFMFGTGFTFLYGRSALRRYVPSTVQSYSPNFKL